MGARMGTLRERLVILTSTPVAVAMATLVQVAGLATATTAAAHGLTDGDFVRIAGATPAGYNGLFKIAVTSATAFTFAADSGLASPATGTITATFDSDAQGGHPATSRTLATIAAELVPIGATERLQATAIGAQTDYRFRVVARPDLTPQMQVQWTPRWPPGSASVLLEVHGVLPDNDGRTFQILNCGVTQ